MEIKYEVFADEQLLIQQFIGQFSLRTYIRYNKFIRAQYTDDEIRKVLIDFRRVIFPETPNGFMSKMNRIIQARQDIADSETNSTGVPRVFWVDQPLPAVIAHIFQIRFGRLNYNYCTTAERVLMNLRLNGETFPLDDKIDHLANHFEKK